MVNEGWGESERQTIYFHMIIRRTVADSTNCYRFWFKTRPFRANDGSVPLPHNSRQDERAVGKDEKLRDKKKSLQMKRYYFPSNWQLPAIFYCQVAQTKDTLVVQIARKIKLLPCQASNKVDVFLWHRSHQSFKNSNMAACLTALTNKFAMAELAVIMILAHFLI